MKNRLSKIKEQIIDSSTMQNLLNENYFSRIRSVFIHVNKPRRHYAIQQLLEDFIPPLSFPLLLSPEFLPCVSFLSLLEELFSLVSLEFSLCSEALLISCDDSAALSLDALALFALQTHALSLSYSLPSTSTKRQGNGCSFYKRLTETK